jgi:DNA-binding transcriptional LysR family regulator
MQGGTIADGTYDAVAYRCYFDTPRSRAGVVGRGAKAAPSQRFADDQGSPLVIELPDLESLRCFVLAATHASFRAAARKAALSPAAFGARIRRLEEQFGQRLFTRSTRRMALTPRGAALLPPAKSCLAEAEHCAEPLGHERPVPFDLVIGSRFDVGLRWVVASFSQLERARPERRLHMAFGYVAELLPRLHRDEVQCVLTSAPLNDPKLTSAPFREIAYLFVGAPTLIKKNPLTRPEDACRHTLIDFDSDLTEFQFFKEARPAKESWTFQKHQYLSIIAAMRERVLEGAGVAVLPDYYVSEDIARGRLKVLMPQTKLKSNALRAVWRKGHPYENEIRELASELAARAAMG